MRRGTGGGGSVGAARPVFVLPLPDPLTRPARGRAALAVVAAWLWVAVQGWVSLEQAWSVRGWVTYAGLGQARAVSAYQHSGVPVLAVAVPAWLCGCWWLARVHATAVRIDPWGQQGDRWLVWQCWVTPAANLVLPARLLADVTRALLRRRPRGMTDDVPLVRLWWAAYLAMVGVGTAASMVSGTRPDQIGLVRTLALAQFVITLSAAWGWTAIVRAVTAAHDRPLLTAGGRRRRGA